MTTANGFRDRWRKRWFRSSPAALSRAAMTKNNRPVAQCHAGNDDLQEQMVLAGWAWAYTQYSDRYVPEEKVDFAIVELLQEAF